MDKTMATIGLVGGGQMGEALVRGMLKAGLVDSSALTVAEPDAERRRYLETTYGITVTDEPAKLCGISAVVILAVKPQVMGPVMAEYGRYLGSEHLVISIVAGVTLERLEAGLGSELRIIRVMPNTPALVLAGMSALSGNGRVDRKSMDTALEIFSAVGRCVEVPESQLDAVTGLSGSGPGYVFAFIEALVDGGVLAGLPRPVAEELVLQTVYGSARLALETGEPAASLRGRVTSPGGTTITGLQVLEEAGLRGTVMRAVQAATDRSRDLGR